MKKISFLKKLGFVLTPVAVASPLVLTLTSCSKTSAITTNYISFDKFHEDGNLSRMKKCHLSYDDILLGTKKFFNGNYILFVGSNAFSGSDGKSSSIAKFFTGSDTTPTKKVDEWFTDYYVSTSIWHNDVSLITDANIAKKIDTKFGFVTFIDNFNFEFYDKKHRKYEIYDNNRGTNENIGPFDTWGIHNGEYLANTRIWNLDKDGKPWFDQKEKIKKTDYIRNDAQAKAFRAFAKRGATLFPTNDKRKKTFDVANDNTTCLMVVYKNGKLQDILDLPTKNVPPTEVSKEDYKDTSTLFGTISKYFTPEEKKDDK